jgi:ubiquinone/menaquinone biosynthesis C-methylase UbiE
MTKPSGKAIRDWTKEYQSSAESAAKLWPSETLVRLFRGNYVPNLNKNYEGRKILEVGCGTCNNFAFYAILGLEIYGTEISREIVTTMQNKLASRKLQATIRVGFNTKLPFEDEFFDYLVSWNVIHYEDNEAQIRRAIEEYARVLKPMGRIFISTTGPEHMILKDSKLLGNHRYQIGRSDDFRKGQIYFYFDSPEYIVFYFSEHFQEILVGRLDDFLFTEHQDYFIMTATRRLKKR